MCSINHDLKAIYFHIPKVAGLYIEEILEKFYNFNTYYFTSEFHYDYIDDQYENFHNFKGFLNIRKKGIYRYYFYSNKFFKLSNMDIDKWNSYFKFTFVRNPFDRCISAYKYLKQYNKDLPSLNQLFLDNSLLNNYEYFHMMITQYDQLIDHDNNINFNFIGRFENLNEDLIIALNKINVKKITHIFYIENNIKVNSSNDNFNIDNIDHHTFDLINQYFLDDFNYFNYHIVSFSNYKDIFEKKNINNTDLIIKYNLHP